MVSEEKKEPSFVPSQMIQQLKSHSNLLSLLWVLLNFSNNLDFKFSSSSCKLPCWIRKIRGKVAGTGAAKIVSFASKVVVFMNVTRESYGYIALVRWRKRKKWDPGWNLNMCIPCWSSKFKQWDLGKIYAMSNSYNLEDNFDFNGGSNVMIQNSACVNTRSKMELVEGTREMTNNPHF
ncbi:uncharacterized protein LOC123900015 [Trifolium pratense]|uniref:uncharacterized protein LOC123900015 n=1 Tax=Trifolium pratense TaxID=57577 RepID=UPI001E6943F3|nr:uncharacterized protein LOC123900015 [Trifolium pratense]